MVVHLKIKETGTVKYLSGQLVPQVGELFVDKLTMTLDVPEELRPETIAGFAKAKASGDGMTVSKTAYSHNLKLSSESDGDILIQCAPTLAKQAGGKYRFFRIEFNPLKADLDNLKKNLDYILPGGYKNLMAAGIVTRIDLAVDALYLDAVDIVASHPKIKVQKHYARNGVIETKYLGASSSSKQIVLYDKVAEIKHSNQKKGKAYKTPVPHDKLFRIEQRFFKLGCTLKDVATLPNPFADLVLIAYPGSKSGKNYDPLWAMFLSACRFEGVQIALKYLNASDQETFKKRLHKEGKTDWWKPDSVWQGLTAAIKTVINVKGYTPLPTLKSSPPTECS